MLNDKCDRQQSEMHEKILNHDNHPYLHVADPPIQAAR